MKYKITNIQDRATAKEYNEKLQYFKKINAKEIEISDFIKVNKITTKDFNKTLEDLGISNQNIKQSKLLNSSLQYIDENTSIISKIISSFKSDYNSKLKSLIYDFNNALSNELRLNIYKDLKSLPDSNYDLDVSYIDMNGTAKINPFKEMVSFTDLINLHIYFFNMHNEEQLSFPQDVLSSSEYKAKFKNIFEAVLEEKVRGKISSLRGSKNVNLQEIDENLPLHLILSNKVQPRRRIDSFPLEEFLFKERFDQYLEIIGKDKFNQIMLASLEKMSDENSFYLFANLKLIEDKGFLPKFSKPQDMTSPNKLKLYQEDNYVSTKNLIVPFLSQEILSLIENKAFNYFHKNDLLELNKFEFSKIFEHQILTKFTSNSHALKIDYLSTDSLVKIAILLEDTIPSIKEKIQDKIINVLNKKISIVDYYKIISAQESIYNPEEITNYDFRRYVLDEHNYLITDDQIKEVSDKINYPDFDYKVLFKNVTPQEYFEKNNIVKLSNNIVIEFNFNKLRPFLAKQDEEIMYINQIFNTTVKDLFKLDINETSYIENNYFKFLKEAISTFDQQMYYSYIYSDLLSQQPKEIKDKFIELFNDVLKEVSKVVIAEKDNSFYSMKPRTVENLFKEHPLFNELDVLKQDTYIKPKKNQLK